MNSRAYRPVDAHVRETAKSLLKVNRAFPRRLLPLLLIAVFSASFALPLQNPFTQAAHAATLPGISVSGNKLVDTNGNVVVLRGVNRAGTEYACEQGWGIFDGDNVMSDDSQVPLMKLWGVNAVNIGLNEDCWLNINGVPAAYAGSNYINAVQHEVTTLENAGIYPIITLFWEAPGTQKATDQIAMPDNDHAPAFWQSVANTFKGDSRVVFRLKEEPFPAGNTDGAGAWQCWKNGDVQYSASGSLTPASYNTNCSEGYQAVGMQSLLNVIRGTGATNVVQVPGVEYANSMTHFLDSTYRVTDTLPTSQLMGVVDVYPVGNTCGSVTCYNAEYAPVIQQMPFLAGEFGESVDGSACGTTNVDALMQWFDQHGAGYLGWAWDTWGGCLQLISSYSTGAPYGNWGTDLKNHLLSMNGPPPTATPTGTTSAATPTGTATSSPTATSTSVTSSPTSTATMAPSPTATPQTTGSSLVLYDNSVAPGFVDGSFGYSSKNSCDSSVYYSPPCSYAIAYTAWGGIYFRPSSGSLDTSGYASLDYELHSNGLPISDFGALFTDASGAVIQEIPLSSANTTAQPNGWVKASLPMSQLNPSNVPITEIQLKNELGGDLPTVNYDDVALVAAGPPSTATPTSTPSPVSPLVFGNFENTMDGFAGNSNVASASPSTWAPAVAMGRYALATYYKVPTGGSMTYIYKSLNLNLSAYSTLKASVYAQKPTVSGPGVRVQFMVQGSDNAWYYSPWVTLTLQTRTMVGWNITNVPRAPLRQLRIQWKFTTSSKSSGNQLYLDAIQAS